MSSPVRPGRLLPPQLTSFIGREREISEAAELLADTRLLTLTGAGGTGKTRLALEVARRLEREEGRSVVWIELASLTDADLIAGEVARAAGIQEQGPEELMRALLEVLDHRSQLLVLDNCEHLVDGCAHLVHELLRGAPQSQVLATSRQPLGVAGERAWLVPPLSISDGDPGTTWEGQPDSEAVQLFAARARDARPDFEITRENFGAVVEICRRLDGIPLAIELAAARVRMLAPEQIADRLDRLFDLLTTGNRTALPRHRTLRAALDWSYRLLSEPERTLLQRLTVFSGGFTLDGVEAVCADREVGEDAVLDLLGSLVDRSLVVARECGPEVRYQLLETVRQYTEEQRTTTRSRNEELRPRHAMYLLSLARAGHRAMEGYQRLDPWLPRLQAEQDNFRAALAWSLDEDPTVAIQLVGALPYLWATQPVHWSEGLRWTERALDRAPAGCPAGDLVAAFWAGGLLAFLCHEWGRAREYLEAASSLARETDQRRSLVLTLGLRALVMAVEGEVGLALPHGEEATRLAREVGEPWLVAVSLITGVAGPLRIRDGLEAAEAPLREALEISLAHGYLWGTWEAGMHLALLALEREEPEEAERLALVAARASMAIGAEWHATRVLLVLASTLAAADHRGRARLLGAAEGWLQSTGGRLLPADEALYQRLLDELITGLGEAETQRCLEEGRGMSLAEAFDLGTSPMHGSGRGGLEQTSPPFSVTQPTPRPTEPAQPASVAVGPAGSGLRARALGPVEIEVGGKGLDPDRWSHGKPQELLFYLLVHPAGRTRSQIGLAFWPDASAAQVKNSFHVLLHKLRKALGDPEIVRLDGDRYLVSPDVHPWLDAAAFEEEMRLLLRDGGADSAPARLKAALALYRGDFLEGIPAGDWHLEIHDRLRRLYADGLSLLADLQIQGGDPSSAADTLEALVHKEPLHEGACRRLMLCLTQTGRRDRALQQFARLRTLLEDELGTDPEPETAQLAAQIRDGASV